MKNPENKMLKTIRLIKKSQREYKTLEIFCRVWLTFG